MSNPRTEYARLQALSLSLDMTRGKPSPEQLDLSNAMLTLPGDDYIADGMDTRNYGGDLPAMRGLFADILGVAADNVLLGGNASLQMMFDALMRACLFGVPGDDGKFCAPWHRDAGRKFICAVPGYDRHFLITEHLGFELVSVDIGADGPDMAQVEAAAADPSVKGIWCVPKYSNPTGACYSAATVARLAQMPAAPDFRIFWDNAYAEHHFTEARPALANIADECEAAGHANRVLQFASTSKMSFPGAGVAALAASDANIADARAHVEVQTIGPDKVNQLRQWRLFAAAGDGDALAGLRLHMQKHAALVQPKFAAVQEILTRELGDGNLAEWSKPQGGYFISLNVADRQAARVIRLAAEAGVKLTAAGAPFPHGVDPRDRNIRIAPTFPSLADVRQATEVLAVCIRLAAAES